MEQHAILEKLQERMHGVRKMLEESKWNEATIEMGDIRSTA
jgi:hypothetical protein